MSQRVRVSISNVRGLEDVIKDIEETLIDLMLLNDKVQSVAVSVYSMTYEEYCFLESRL
jgi:hypothetical protein